MTDHCIVIPVFNHGKQFQRGLKGLLSHSLPVILVNDASDHETSKILREIARQNTQVQLVEHEVNQGKGGAVLTGLRTAKSRGFTHALQVDADGQHDLSAVPAFIEASQSFPQHVICGYPVYDDSIPKLRLRARYFNHFWVWLETLSFRIRDSMCGFRVYPVDVVVALADRVKLGKRMDFDVEVLVRLDWANVKFHYKPINVIYPEDGSSNFKPFYDNWLITKMHTRLVLGMLWRWPVLLFRR